MLRQSRVGLRKWVGMVMWGLWWRCGGVCCSYDIIILFDNLRVGLAWLVEGTFIGVIVTDGIEIFRNG